MAKKRKKRAGRPEKPDGDRKGGILQVRVDDREKATFDAAAKLNGLDMSSWVRLRLRESAMRELTKAGQEVPFLASHGPGRKVQ
jgi:hypothetical protein